MCNFIEVFDKILFCSSQRLYQLQKAKMNISLYMYCSHAYIFFFPIQGLILVQNRANAVINR